MPKNQVYELKNLKITNIELPKPQKMEKTAPMVSTQHAEFDHLPPNSTNLVFQKCCKKTKPFPKYTDGGGSRTPDFRSTF